MEKKCERKGKEGDEEETKKKQKATKKGTLGRPRAARAPPAAPSTAGRARGVPCMPRIFQAITRPRNGTRRVNNSSLDNDSIQNGLRRVGGASGSSGYSGPFRPCPSGPREERGGLGGGGPSLFSFPRLPGSGSPRPFEPRHIASSAYVGVRNN